MENLTWRTIQKRKKTVLRNQMPWINAQETPPQYDGIYKVQNIDKKMITYLLLSDGMWRNLPDYPKMNLADVGCWEKIPDSPEVRKVRRLLNSICLEPSVNLSKVRSDTPPYTPSSRASAGLGHDKGTTLLTECQDGTTIVVECAPVIESELSEDVDSNKCCWNCGCMQNN